MGAKLKPHIPLAVHFDRIMQYLSREELTIDESRNILSSCLAALICERTDMYREAGKVMMMLGNFLYQTYKDRPNDHT